MTRAVVTCRQPALGNSHAHTVGEPLPERSGGHLKAGNNPIFRVAGCPAAPLAKLLDVIQRQVIAGQVQQRIEHCRRVATGKNKTVAVWPFGVLRVVLEKPVPEDVSHRCGAKRSSRMAGIGLLYRINRQKPYRVYAELINSGIAHNVLFCYSSSLHFCMISFRRCASLGLSRRRAINTGQPSSKEFCAAVAMLDRRSCIPRSVGWETFIPGADSSCRRISSAEKRIGITHALYQGHSLHWTIP